LFVLLAIYIDDCSLPNEKEGLEEAWECLIEVEFIKEKTKIRNIAPINPKNHLQNH